MLSKRTKLKLSQGKWDTRGFTLIELLVVILIIGILSGIAITAVSGARENAVVKACDANENTLLQAVSTYFVTNGSYPATSGPAIATALVPTYLQTMPPYVGDPDGQEYYLNLSIVNVNGDDVAKITSSKNSDGTGGEVCASLGGG